MRRVDIWFGYDTNRRIYKMARLRAAWGALRYAGWLRRA